VIGAGHAGLAASRLLTERSIDHVVLDRGEVANSWRRERWDSLRLLTPNWQSRLPGHRYEGPDPDGFMTMAEVIAFISRFATVSRAPVRTNTIVTSVMPSGDGYHVATSNGDIGCRSVVIASGACNLPIVPTVRDAVPAAIEQVTPLHYRNPAQLPDGGVLVVGASATGVQVAHEIQRSGRQVTLAVGEHVRGPRLYRGRDIQWWMEVAGVLGEHYDEVDDIVRARRVPSMQLAGSPERATFDLNALTAIGVKLVGKLATIRDGRALFSGSLRNKCELADLKLGRLLTLIDEWATANGLDDETPPPHRFEPTVVPQTSTLGVDLTNGEIQTVLWATGFRPDYSWLDVDVLDGKGMVRHDGGVVVDAPGMYLIGMPFLRRRKSSFIDGAREDAEDLIVELAAYLDTRAAPAWRRSSRFDG
jgi:putative flavoprotein involved in K+ transport